MAFAKLTMLARRTLLLAAAAAGAMGLCMFSPTRAVAQQSDKTTPAAFVAAPVSTAKSGTSEGRCAPNASVGQTFTVRNCPLGALIWFAYDVLQEQVSG
jgi:hypothetical protein